MKPETISPPPSPPLGANRLEYMMDLARKKVQTQQKQMKNKPRQDCIVGIISIVGQRAADDAKLEIDVERCITRTLDMIDAAQEALERQAEKNDGVKGTAIDKRVFVKDLLALWEAKKRYALEGRWTVGEVIDAPSSYNEFLFKYSSTLAINSNFTIFPVEFNGHESNPNPCNVTTPSNA
ncbi:hypothetical protein CERZMDRAFT_81383 [Cercospora zeae-maydis SCOH1-5]|uniref:Uncharacterized protein n=1 Tax=Cercospora zeae-maydis SCOH1-5 TaxID=717836 RepID=A0A6A6FSF6_9PEZI|nr:hypothetical protein CERZMDRAFT_81383 [Cercospora zeae-maydis SCOH1-5]